MICCFARCSSSRSIGWSNNAVVVSVLRSSLMNSARRHPAPVVGDEQVREEVTPASPVRPRYQLAGIVCDDCKRGWLTTAGQVTLLAPAELACAQCDCDDIGRVDIAGEARKRTSIPPARKRKVLARDKHRCRVPGCRSTNVDVHHICPWALGGSHDESNLITLCEAHHLAVHRGTLVLRGNAIDATFTFAAANRFTLETRVVETKAELRRRGISRDQAAAAVDAVRTHVGTQSLSSDGWLALALARVADGRSERQP